MIVKHCKTRIFYIKIIRKYMCLCVRNVFYFLKKVRLFSQNGVLFLFYFLINLTMTTAKLLPTANEVCEGNVFTGVCPQRGVSIYRGPGVGLCPGEGHLGPEGVCQGETPLTVKSRWYTSYWNAFLFINNFEFRCKWVNHPFSLTNGP